MSTNIRELSKRTWNVGENTLENINAGSLQRIADATEIMANNYVRMQADLDYYQREYKRRGNMIKHLENSRAAYKAHLTRLRNKLSAGANP